MDATDIGGDEYHVVRSHNIGMGDWYVRRENMCGQLHLCVLHKELSFLRQMFI